MEILDNNHLDLPDDLAASLEETTVENVRLLEQAQQVVEGDTEAAYLLVGEQPIPELPEPSENERRMAAYLVLLTRQHEWFGQIETSPHAPGYELGNVAEGSIFIRSRLSADGTLTLLELTTYAQHRAHAHKHVIIHTPDGRESISSAPNMHDKKAAKASISRLQEVNDTWRELLDSAAKTSDYDFAA